VREIASKLRSRSKLGREETSQAIRRVTGELAGLAERTAATGPLPAGGRTTQPRSMTTTLITGANKGLGKETARQLVVAGHTVYVGARDEARGRAAAGELGARFVQLEVAGDASVAAACTQIEADGGLDVLINNRFRTQVLLSPWGRRAGALPSPSACGEAVPPPGEQRR
jgi:hypothetical protein